MPISNIVNIDVLSDEPEVPLTGYNYARYKNEGTILFQTAQSAHRVS